MRIVLLVLALNVWQPFKLVSFDRREIEGEITTLAVRENRDERNSRFIRVAVVRLPAKTPGSGSPIVFLSGGPGIPATALARVPVYFDLFEKLRTQGDVLLIDQRGSGMSLPNLTCPEAAIPNDFLTSDATLRAALLERVSACAQYWRTGAVDLRGYSTREIAADVSAARLAIGAKKVRLVAFSYGSEVAIEIARRWPDSVERIVFASTRAPDTLLKRPSDWDAVLRRLGLFDRFAEEVAKLDREPITLDPFRAGGIALLTILRSDLPDGRAIGRLPSLLDRDVLATRVQQVHASLAKSFNLMTLAVDCSSGWTPARLELTRREARGSLMRNVNLQWDPDVCERIAGVGTPPPIPRVRVPAMFITGTLDANAPVAQTEAIRKHFPRSIHKIVENGAHETLPVADVQDEVVKFLGHRN